MLKRFGITCNFGAFPGLEAAEVAVRRGAGAAFRRAGCVVFVQKEPGGKIFPMQIIAAASCSAWRAGDLQNQASRQGSSQMGHHTADGMTPFRAAGRGHRARRRGRVK